MANNNQKFIKSYSVFVKKKTHQQVNDGTIFERDWLTTGGVDKFLPGQIPIYKNGNFIITVNNDPIQSKDYVTDDFEKINGQDEWTLEEIEKAETNEDNNITPDNLLKNNIYDLINQSNYTSIVISMPYSWDGYHDSTVDATNPFPNLIINREKIIKRDSCISSINEVSNSEKEMILTYPYSSLEDLGNYDSPYPYESTKTSSEIDPLLTWTVNVNLIMVNKIELTKDTSNTSV